jgi:DnaJ-class molecular chaperone
MKDKDIKKILEELGLDSKASVKEIESAWRKQAAKYHPDKHGSTEKVMRCL